MIRANAGKLFPGMVIEARACSGSAVTRRSNSTIPTALSKRALVEQEVQQRRFEPVVRLEVQPDAEPEMVAELTERFAAHLGRRLRDDARCSTTPRCSRSPGWRSSRCAIRRGRRFRRAASRPATGDIFSAIRAGDILLHQPYDSFYAGVERFIREAADDPQTVSIKMTVYRVGDDTPFVQSLIRAAESGKQVACVIELNARFDEARNLHWSRELEKVGAHVMFGVLGLKTHSKAALVVRSEEGGMRCYAHIATGNYHTRTARLYEDVGLLTANPAITGDVVNLFHFLTGRSRTPSFPTLLVAPMDMRARFVELIEREIENHAGRASGSDHLQDEPARGRRAVPAALAGLAGGRADRSDRARALLPRPGRAGPDREHPHPVDRRPLPRALPHLSLRRRLR